ncbi:MAG: PAS domain S-box protein [Mariniphaga sp.]
MGKNIKSVKAILRRKAEKLLTERGISDTFSALKSKYLPTDKPDKKPDNKLINPSAFRLINPSASQSASPSTDLPANLSDADTLKLLHELEVHHIELNMQNEELTRAINQARICKEKAELNAKKYAELYDFAPSGYFTLSKEGRIVEMNLAGAKMLSKERSLLKNRLFQFLLSENNIPLFILFLNNVFAGKITQTCELTLAQDGFLPLHLFVTGIMTDEEQCLLTIVDISDRKRTEDALRQSEQDCDNILNEISDVVWSLSWPDMKVNYISPSVEQLYGLPLKDFIENPSLWESMAHPDDKHISEKAMNQLLAEGTAVRECRIVRPDGSIVWINDKSKVIYDKDNTIVRVDGVSRDITEEKQAAIFREINHKINQILNESGDLKVSVHRVIDCLKKKTGFDAIGIRLQQGDDFPYFAQNGFSSEFLSTKNTLIGHTKAGGLCRDKSGNIKLECTCGLVISGKTDPENPSVTVGGSIWTNDSLTFLEIAPGDDLRFHPRNQCIHQGYASVALIPVRTKDKNIGLIQFNDHRKGCFTIDMIDRLEGMAMYLGEAIMRKQAEEELQKSNELFALFMHHSPIYAFIKEVTSTESRTLKASDNYRDMIGIPGSEMIGKTMFELFPAEIAASITADDYAVVSNNEIIEIEETFNGHIYSSIKFPISRNGQNLLAGFSLDITERKVLEKKLQENELKYRLLFETAQEGILVAQGTNFKFVNPMSMELTGYSEAELLTLHFLEIVHPDDREFVINNFQKRINNKPAENRYTIRIYKKDNSLRYFELSGAKTEWEGEPAVIIFVADITNRIHAEQALKKSESHARALINAMPDMIFILSSEGVYINYKAAKEDLGYQQKSLIGLNNRDITPPEFADLIDEKIKITLQTLKIQVFEYQFQFPTGETGEYEARMVPGGSDEVIVIVRNITERKKAEAEIIQKNEDLQKLNSEKDKFFSVIAHDLLNPFQTLLGFSSTMGEDLLNLPLEKVQKIAMNMRSSANKLFYLLENLLEWSQIQRSGNKFKPVRLNLTKRIDEIIELIQDTADKKMIVISVDIPEELSVMADSQMFESMMRNLVYNAIKFTPPQGRVTIAAVPLSDNLVEISITDTGIGMDQTIIDHLFILDSQINRKGTEGESSTGLGLIICKDFIERHGGKILVESKVDKGSTFRFTLPKYI